MSSLVLHEDVISMNCYKIRLTAALLSIPLQRQSYSTLKGETRTAHFLNNVSSYGRIPVLEIRDLSQESSKPVFLPESNAACYYLAESNNLLSGEPHTGKHHQLIPSTPLQRAEMMRWLFFEQNQHEVTIATLRFWTKYLGGPEKLDHVRRIQYDSKRVQAEQVLDCMEEHLAMSKRDGSGWFVKNCQEITLADVVLFAYTHVMDEGGFEVERWQEIKAWCQRVRDVDGWVDV